ncbi:MAG TPA: hypothetical protein ENI23_01890 [bacterium]|nr:hypothetical protein [bacterium]
MVTKTQQRRHKLREERERKAKISAAVTAKQRSQTSVHAKDPAREELRQRQLRKGGELAKDVAEKDIEATAKRSFEIGEEKERLKEEKLLSEEVKKPTTADLGNELLESGELTKVREEGKETIDTETIRFTDESGFEREIQMPAGTSNKIAAAKAKREGRVPFTELPVYQQFLAGAIVTGVSPAGLTTVGKKLNILGKPLSIFMKSTLGKYVGNIALYGGIMTWLASDNIIGTMSIYTRDLAEDVTFGKISKEEALDKIDDGDAFVEGARNFIRGATLAFPILWPFRGLILANADAAELAIEENKERIKRA